jgi:hypothetical protein
VLTSDALAKWILTQIEQGRPEWQKILSMQNAREFAHHIDKARTHWGLEDDDITLLMVPVE